MIIREQGIFSAGGVILTTDGKFDPIHGQFDPTGQTHHADHANVLYQIPVIFLHGYGQSRMGWMITPDRRPGWSDIFLRKGYGVYLSNIVLQNVNHAVITTNGEYLIRCLYRKDSV